MPDPQLSYDAAQMMELRGHPAWTVLQRYLERMRGQAIDRMANPLESDQGTHHWRGVYTALTDLLALPERIIDAAKGNSG